jgi:hypothetical protein
MQRKDYDGIGRQRDEFDGLLYDFIIPIGGSRTSYYTKNPNSITKSLCGLRILRRERDLKTDKI